MIKRPSMSIDMIFDICSIKALNNYVDDTSASLFIHVLINQDQLKDFMISIFTLKHA